MTCTTRRVTGVACAVGYCVGLAHLFLAYNIVVQLQIQLVVLMAAVGGQYSLWLVIILAGIHQLFYVPYCSIYVEGKKDHKWR